MGLRIDKFVLTVLLAAALYVFFIGATGSIPLAAASAFLAMAILKKLSEKLPTDRIGRNRRTAASAKSELEELSLSSHDTALHRITTILRHAYGSSLDGIELRLILRHPSTQITTDDIRRIWRSLNGRDRAVIAATAVCSDSVHDFASRLRNPRIELIGSDQLVRLIAASGPAPCGLLSGRNGTPKRLAAAVRAAGRAKAGKCAVTAMLMFAIFWMTGVAAYLIGSLLLIFICGMSLRKRRIPHELFSD